MATYAIVLTGGIATGKSTVVSMLKKHDFEVVDADVISREVLPLCKEQIKIAFGEIIIKNNEIDRKALGDIVFKDKEERKKLNDIIHPLIKKEILKRCELLNLKKKPYIVDIPLYYESKGYPCSMVVVVYAPLNVQLERLMRREKYTREEAMQRINAQICIEEKRKKADFVINNTFNEEALEQEIEKFILYVKAHYERQII